MPLFSDMYIVFSVIKFQVVALKITYMELFFFFF